MGFDDLETSGTVLSKFHLNPLGTYMSCAGGHDID